MAKGFKSGGRKKGTPNKQTTVRAVWEQVFHKLQSDPLAPHTLENWAMANLTDYYKTATKLVPQATEVTGEGGGPLEFIVKRADTDAT